MKVGEKIQSAIIQKQWRLSSVKKATQVNLWTLALDDL